MANTERIEKIRQAIMRYQELLELLQATLQRGEADYERLFAALPDKMRDTLAHKDLQTEAAYIALENLDPLRYAVLNLQLEMRGMEREFEALYGHIAPQPDAIDN